MKIAIIAFHFKPDEAIGSVRAENWAAWLSNEHEVAVVTRDMRLADDADERRYRIVRARSLSIRLIERLNIWRKERRANRTLAPSSSERSVPKVTTGAFVYRMPCLHDAWLLAAYRALRHERPDLIIATHSPYVSVVAAWLYAIFNPNVKLWLDFRDLWSQHHLVRGLPIIRRLEYWIESKALSRADLVSSVSKGYIAKLGERVPEEKQALIYNAPTEMLRSASVREKKDKTFTICYTGNIYTGWRDPSALLELFARLQQESNLTPMQGRLVVASRMSGDLTSLISQTGTAEFVDFLGPVSRSEALRLQSEADVLLLLESPAQEADGTVPAKVFEYLATDKPILIIGPGPRSEIYQLVQQHGRIITLEQIASILVDGATMPTQTRVDYSELSMAQLRKAISSLGDQ